MDNKRKIEQSISFWHCSSWLYEASNNSKTKFWLEFRIFGKYWNISNLIEKIFKCTLNNRKNNTNETTHVSSNTNRTNCCMTTSMSLRLDQRNSLQMTPPYRRFWWLIRGVIWRIFGLHGKSLIKYIYNFQKPRKKGVIIQQGGVMWNEFRWWVPHEFLQTTTRQRILIIHKHLVDISLLNLCLYVKKSFKFDPYFNLTCNIRFIRRKNRTFLDI